MSEVSEVVALATLILGCTLFIVLIGLMVRDIIRLHERHKFRQNLSHLRDEMDMVEKQGFNRHMDGSMRKRDYSRWPD